MRYKKGDLYKGPSNQQSQPLQRFYHRVDNVNVKVDFQTLGKRLTEQRSAILEILANTTSHPTAESIYEQVKKTLPHISLATVYRNLKILRDESFILELHLIRGLSRFDYNTSPHYHIFCVKCGKLEDLNVPSLEDIDTKAALITGYQVLSHQIQFLGVCPQCRNCNG